MTRCAVLTQRNAAYDDPGKSLSVIAARWSLTLGQEITPAQVALCMIDLKLARHKHNSTHRDSVIDVIGYAALLSEVTP
jgi:hypothetical protein